MVDPERSESEEPGLAVEEAAEDTRSIEARHTEPVDRAVGCDERSRVAVRKERVVRDRWKRRRESRALLARLRRHVDAHDTIQGLRQRPWPSSSSFAASGPHDPCA